MTAVQTFGPRAQRVGAQVTVAPVRNGGCGLGRTCMFDDGPALHSIFAVATAAEGPAHPVHLIRGVSPMATSARRMTPSMCRANFLVAA